jgi:hypothetical protein
MVRPGSKVWIPVNTFDSNDPSASVTATTWLNTDCHVHKDGAVGQRASSAGETLSINFDTVTGNDLIEIDTADNTTANFYEAGSTYHVRIEGVTVDAGNVNAWIGTFSIGYPGAVLNTTIATLASQTSFTLEDGSLDASAYVGYTAVIHDLASAVQVATGYVSAYAVTTKTVTLAADPGIFTMAAGDSISLFPPAQVASWNNVPLATTNPLPNAAADAAGGLPVSDLGGLDLDAMNTNINDIETDTGTTLQAELDAIQAAVITNAAGVDIAADIIAIKAETALIVADTNELQTDDIPGTIAALNDIAAADVWAVDATTQQTQGTFGQAIGDPVADTTTIYQSVATNAAGDNVAVDIAAVKAETALIVADTNELQTDDVPGLIAALNDPTAATIADAVWDEAATGHTDAGKAGEQLWTDVDAILADTNELQTDDVPGLIAALQDISTADVLTQVNAAIDTAISELGVAAPTATPTIRTALMLMYMMTRNKLVVQTSGTDAIEVYNNAGTKIAAKAITDDGSDYTEAEMA